MNCSPCGSSSNYSSVSTSDCVTLCGAGISTTTTVIGVISTYITNPYFSLSSLNISTLYITVIVPSVISTFVSISDISVHISTTLSTFITNPYINVNIPSTISTFVTNSNLSVNVANFPLQFSTYITNPCISLCGAGISTNVTNSNLSVNVANFPFSFSTFVTNSNLSVNVANFPLSFSTFVTNSNLSVNVANFPLSFSTFVTNSNLSVNVANFPLSFSTFVTNSNLSVNVANFPLAFSTFVTNSNLSVNVANFPLSFSTFVTNSNLSVNVANFPLSFSTFVTNTNLSVNVANFPLSFSTFVTNTNLSVNVANFPLAFSTFVTNSNLSVNVANFPLSFSTFVTNSNLSVNVANFPLSFSTFVTNPSLTVNIPSTISTTTTITGSISISSPVSTVTVKNILTDVFNRVYVNSPTTTLASHPAFTPQYELLDYHSTGTGFVSTISISTITILQASGSGGRAIRQTREYQLYQPGNSHLVQFTMTPQFLGTFDSSVAVRAGIYDDYRDKNTPAGTTGAPPYLYQSSIYGGTGKETNQPSMGHFFELEGSNWFVVERYNSPDNIQNVTRVAQSNWNVDTFDGTGPSGYTLQTTTPSLLFVERQWLGVGVVRMGAFYNTLFLTCHIFQNRSYTMPYTHLNKLPIRYEIEKVAGGSANAAIMASICASSHIGAEYVPYGRIYSLPVNLTYEVTRIGITTLRPVLLLRLQQQFCRATFKVKDIELYGAAPGAFSVFWNPVVSGTITWTKHPDVGSMLEYAYFPSGSTSTRTVTGGRCIRSGFFSTRTALQDGLTVGELLTAQAFASDIHGTPDVFCIAMVAFTANTDVNANARWIEIV